MIALMYLPPAIPRTVVDTGTRGELVPYRTLGALSAWPNSTQRFHPIGVATISGSTYLRSSTTSPNSLIYSCIQIILDPIKIRRVLAIIMIVRALSIAICECGPSRWSTIAFQGANGPVNSSVLNWIVAILRSRWDTIYWIMLSLCMTLAFLTR
jgi:hypothetical protein